MSEKTSLARLLRTPEVYQDAGRTTAGQTPAGADWREALLADFEHAAPAPHRTPAPARTPLQPHHLAMLAPAGAGLFLAGWLLGSGRLALDRLAAVPPPVWMAGAVALSLAVLAGRGRLGRRGRAQ
jgi:hypothetical protein